VPDPGVLYLCSTPIGNMEDITLRALRVLREVDLVAAEDTRRTGLLLRRHGIEAPLISYHEHNEVERAQELVERLLAGESVALVSDAGTPAISDPGYEIVRRAVDAGVKVVAVPGASALLAALIASGLPPQPFYFGGFLPRRSAERRRLLDGLASLAATLVFYEAPHRLTAALDDVASVFPDRTVAVARELTKVHEEIVRGPAVELLRRFSDCPPKGECVLVIGPEEAPRSKGREITEDEIARALAASLKSGKTKKEAVREVASHLGVSRNRVYDAAIQLSLTDTPESADS